MAKLDAGELELDIEPTKISDIIQASLTHCKAALACREVIVKVDDSLPPVKADLERIKEAVVQFIDNANLYSSKEQPITITAELTGDCVTTSVSDRGPGIDDFEQTMIFDKFYRGKDQRYLVRGTGMGLPIAKAIITAHKGTVSVTSQLGHGSVFSFTLPVSRPSDRASTQVQLQDASERVPQETTSQQEPSH
jgi:two-component system sensor histidine kinase KdpD